MCITRRTLDWFRTTSYNKINEAIGFLKSCAITTYCFTESFAKGGGSIKLLFFSSSTCKQMSISCTFLSKRFSLNHLSFQKSKQFHHVPFKPAIQKVQHFVCICWYTEKLLIAKLPNSLQVSSHPVNDSEFRASHNSNIGLSSVALNQAVLNAMLSENKLDAQHIASPTLRRYQVDIAFIAIPALLPR